MLSLQENQFKKTESENIYIYTTHNAENNVWTCYVNLWFYKFTERFGNL